MRFSPTSFRSFPQVYLKDTKSSNGTFINNQRLSKGGEDSAPRDLYSCDIVQFGVDIMENKKSLTIDTNRYCSLSMPFCFSNSRLYCGDGEVV